MKKTIAICDKCGKKMTRWLEIEISCDTLYEIINVSDILKYKGRYDICKNCAEKLSMLFVKKQAN